MRDPLSQAIAKQLAYSNVGLFRKQLFDKIETGLTAGKIDKISLALNAMSEADHVAKSPRQGADGSRWSLTPKGRAAYSVLNDEKLDVINDSTTTVVNLGQQDPPTDDSENDEYLPEHLLNQDNAPDPTMEFLDNHKLDSAFLRFDTRETLDRALYGLVQLIRSEAEHQAPTIERKAEKLELLARMQNNDLLPGNVRALLGYIKQDIEQLEGIDE